MENLPSDRSFRLSGRAITTEKRSRFWTREPFFEEYITEFEIELDYRKQMVFCRYWTPETVKEKKPNIQTIAEFTLSREDLQYQRSNILYHQIYGEDLAKAVAGIFLTDSPAKLNQLDKDCLLIEERSVKLREAIEDRKVLKKSKKYRRTFLVKLLETPPLNWDLSIKLWH